MSQDAQSTPRPVWTASRPTQQDGRQDRRPNQQESRRIKNRGYNGSAGASQSRPGQEKQQHAPPLRAVTSIVSTTANTGTDLCGAPAAGMLGRPPEEAPRGPSRSREFKWTQSNETQATPTSSESGAGQSRQTRQWQPSRTIRESSAGYISYQSGDASRDQAANEGL